MIACQKLYTRIKSTAIKKGLKQLIHILSASLSTVPVKAVAKEPLAPLPSSTSRVLLQPLKNLPFKKIELTPLDKGPVGPSESLKKPRDFHKTVALS